jgi:predicted house-cleaning NTP pyrophosphatase (Maf/HAM1 superfamily)
VACKGEEAAEEEKPAHKDWREHEVGLIVADYFTMLEKELLGKPFSKTEHRRSLAPKLSERSGPSIEFKHANISAVLTGLGLPYVEG